MFKVEKQFQTQKTWMPTKKWSYHLLPKSTTKRFLYFLLLVSHFLINYISNRNEKIPLIYFEKLFFLCKPRNVSEWIQVRKYEKYSCFFISFIHQKRQMINRSLTYNFLKKSKYSSHFSNMCGWNVKLWSRHLATM